MRPHPYSQTHQMTRPHGSRYGYRVNTYSVPCRFGPAGNGRSRQMSTMHGTAMLKPGQQSEDSTSTDRSSNNMGQPHQQQLDQPLQDQPLQDQQLQQQSLPVSTHSHQERLPKQKPHKQSVSSSGSQSSSPVLRSKQNSLHCLPTTPSGSLSTLSPRSSSHCSSGISNNDSEADNCAGNNNEQAASLTDERLTIADKVNDKLDARTGDPAAMKQVDNIFLQPTGPVMPTMPIMHYYMPQNGGQGEMAPLVFDMNDGNSPNTNFAQFLPNINMNMNMNINMNMFGNPMGSSVPNVHVMSHEMPGNYCQLLPDVTMMNPSLMLPYSTYNNSNEPFTPVDMHENFSAANPINMSIPLEDKNMILNPNVYMANDMLATNDGIGNEVYHTADLSKESNNINQNLTADECEAVHKITSAAEPEEN